MQYNLPISSINLLVFEKPVQYEIDLVKQWLLLTKGTRIISITGEDSDYYQSWNIE